jgi:hypothetical protein
MKKVQLLRQNNSKLLHKSQTKYEEIAEELAGTSEILQLKNKIEI